MISSPSTLQLLRSPPLLQSTLSAKRHSKSPSPSCVRFRPVQAASGYASAERTRPACSFSPKMASTCSFYEVLGISMGATSQEIKAAYRRLARVCHPDIAAIDRKDSSADEFMKIHAAYSTLSDPNKRADYDRRILRPRRSFGSHSVVSASSTPVVPRFTGYTRRNWETDQCW